MKILNRIEIVLMFKEIYEYNNLDLVNGLVKVLPDIGKPNILNIPEDIPLKIKLGLKKIIFSENETLKLGVSKEQINFTLINENDINKIKEYVSNICEVLEELKLKVKSIGIVNSFIYNKINFEKMKQIFFSDNEAQNSDLFNLSWYKKEEDMNIWKHIKTFKTDEFLNMEFIIDTNNINLNEELSNENILLFLSEKEKIVTDLKNNLERKMED